MASLATGSKKVDRWLKEDYPLIREQADISGATIFFLDESTAKSEAHRGRTWSPKGITPNVKATGSRHRLNLVSAVSSEGLLRYRTFQGSMNQFAFIRFLKTLVKSVKTPIIVITDGHPAHRAKSVQEYVAKEPRLLGLHLLPSYSPELNPDEQVWNNLKRQLGKTALKTKEDFVGFVRTIMRKLQNAPEIVAGFFRMYHTQYACR